MVVWSHVTITRYKSLLLKDKIVASAGVKVFENAKKLYYVRIKVYARSKIGGYYRDINNTSTAHKTFFNLKNGERKLVQGKSSHFGGKKTRALSAQPEVTVSPILGRGKKMYFGGKALYANRIL